MAVLSRHVLFEIESIDRLYLNLYVPELQRVLRKWLARLPHPFTPADRADGYRYMAVNMTGRSA